MTLQLSVRRFEQAFYNFIVKRLESWETSEFFDIYPSFLKTHISFSDTFPKKVKELNGKTIVSIQVTSDLSQNTVYNTHVLRPLISLNIFSPTRSKNLEAQEFLIELISSSNLSLIKMIDNVEVSFGFLERRVSPSFDSASDIFNSFLDFRFFLRQITIRPGTVFSELLGLNLNINTPNSFNTSNNNSNFLNFTVSSLESHSRSFDTLLLNFNQSNPNITLESHQRDLISISLNSDFLPLEFTT